MATKKPAAKPAASAPKKAKTPGAIPNFPRVSSPRPVERMVMGTSQVPKQSGRPLHLITCAGVLLEITPHRTDADRAKSSIAPSLEYRHEILHETGRRTLVENRNAN